MDLNELNIRLKTGEDSCHQFKENFNSIDQLSVEIVAFANSQGGKIFIGVNDDGEIIGLIKADIKRLNQWISNSTSQKIEPPIFVRTEILLVENRSILIIDIPMGINKPYCVNKSEFWVKNGADKRRATRDELFRLMQASRNLFADEMPSNVTLDEFDYFYFSEFYKQAFEEDPKDMEIHKETLLNNLKLLDNHQLTLAGLLLFGKNPGNHKPQFGIKGTVYITEDSFRDKEDICGKLFEQQKKGVDFILRNLHREQPGNDFNAPGELEIPVSVIKEVVANALIHRDYFINSSVFINIYNNRVEVSSPGVLPDTITVENIKLGIHIERNPILLSFASKEQDFGYTGRGSGIPRVLRICSEKGISVDLINDLERNCFKVVLSRRKVVDAGN